MGRRKGQKLKSSGGSQAFLSAPWLLFLPAMLGIALSCQLVHGQINPSGPSIFGSGPISSGNHSSPQERALRKALAAERSRHQHEMVSDVAKLLELAKELNREERREGSDPQANSDKARQIEKLAHRVQTLMREAGDG